MPPSKGRIPPPPAYWLENETLSPLLYQPAPPPPAQLMLVTAPP